MPLGLYIFLIIIKFFTTKRMNLFYILLLIILPISAYILIHKIILEKYYELQFMRQNNILFYDFFKLFFAGYTPFIIFRYLCLVLGIKTKAGYINILIILYSTYISGKILCEYLLTLSILNKENIKYYKSAMKKDKKVIYFIYLIIYYLISHILNL